MPPLIIFFRMLIIFKEQIEGFADDDAGQKDHKKMLLTLLQFV